MRDLHVPWWLAGATVAIAITLSFKGAYAASLMNLVAIAALIAASMRFVLLIGELSFATSAFVGLGAYGAGIATALFDWPFPVALILGPLAVIVVSALFGYVTLRIKGPYFMLIGFAFTEAVRISFTKVNAIGGVTGLPGIFPPQFLDSWMPTFVALVVMGLLFGLYAVEKSDFGKTLVAIRDNEDIARTVGVDVLAFKVACFVIASFCAGVAGSLQAFVNNVISPSDFGFLVASFALAYVKIGGESSIFGAITGAIFLSLLGSYALGFGAGEHFIYGGAMVLAMLLMPKGFIGLFATLRARYSRPAKATPLAAKPVAAQ